jgi:ATP synthase protein I
MSDAAPPPGKPEPRSEEPRPAPKDLAELRSGKTAAFAGAGRYAGLGLQFAISIILFLYVGQWIDRRYGTDPLFLILGVFLGATAAFYSMYRSLVAGQKKDEEREARLKQQKLEKEEKDEQDRA